MSVKKAVKKKITIGTALNYLLIILLTFVCLYPFLNVLSISFSGYDAVLSGGVTFYPIDFSMEAYKQIAGQEYDLDIHENDGYHHTFRHGPEPGAHYVCGIRAVHK